MSDKLRGTQPLKITFSDGEQPSSTKLTAVSEQSRNGSKIIEKAIGDLWNQSGDEWLSNAQLQIPNLARTVGPTAYLNPAIYPGEQNFDYKENIGDKYTGKTNGYLLFKPLTGGLINIGSIGWTIRKSNERDILVSGDFWLDDSTGRWRSFDPVVAGEKFIYKVSPAADWIIGKETLPSVIPDPNQSDFTSCRMSISSGRYLLHLPPRRPLALNANDIPENYPPAVDIPDNIASADGAPFKYWGDGITAITGVTSDHYRYSLSKDLLDVFVSITAGNKMPDGIMYLWNQTTNTIIDGVIFKKPTFNQSKYVIEVDFSNSNFDPVPILTSTESEGDYSGTNLSLIIASSSIAKNIWYLNSSLSRHKHDNTTQNALVSHTVLLNQNPPSIAYTIDGHNTRYPSYIPPWSPSNWAFDSHTSLLNRSGSQASGFERDLYNNAMLGDLVLANADPATFGVRDYLNSVNPDNSFRLYFGDINGPSIFADATSGLTIAGNIAETKAALTITGVASAVAMDITGGTGNFSAILAKGSGSKFGIESTGGDINGTGIQGAGGPTNGKGVVGYGVGTGDGITGYGLGTGSGVRGIGGTNADGVVGLGVGLGRGVRGTGGTNADGVFGSADGTGDGVRGISSGSGAGIKGTSSGSGVGVKGTGGTDSDGVVGQGTGAGIGVQGTGGTDSIGVVGNGTGFANGVLGIGLGTGGGVLGTGGTNAPGVSGHGTGTGTGVRGFGDGTGVGVWGFGGTNANGTNGDGTGTGDGVRGRGLGSGVGVRGIGGTDADGVVGNGTGTGDGISGIGLGTGVGVTGTGGTNANGVVGNGTGNGAGVLAVGLGTGPGIIANSGTNGTGVFTTGDGNGPGVNATGGLTGGDGVNATGNGTGDGIRGTATGAGYGGYFQGKTSSPSKSALHINPQNAQPTTGAIGDMYVTTAGILKIYTVAGTWTNVGSQ